MAAEEGQQHPLKIYWIMWIALFVLSGFSYATDFMERLALKLAILGPPVAILVLIWLMALEGHYVEDTRVEYYGESTFEPATPHHE